MKRENKQKNITLNEILTIIGLTCSVVIFLILVTKDLIFGEPGNSVANFFLGTFGFSSYALTLFFSVYLIMRILGKEIRGNKSIIAYVILMIVSLLLVVHLLTSSAALIQTNNMSFTDYVMANYNLSCGGLEGASCGGLLVSVLMYYPIKAVNTLGCYIFILILFVGALLALISKARMLKGETPLIKTTKNQVYPTQAYPIEFASSINEIKGNEEPSRSFDYLKNDTTETRSKISIDAIKNDLPSSQEKKHLFVSGRSARADLLMKKKRELKNDLRREEYEKSEAKRKLLLDREAGYSIFDPDAESKKKEQAVNSLLGTVEEDEQDNESRSYLNNESYYDINNNSFGKKSASNIIKPISDIPEDNKPPLVSHVHNDGFDEDNIFSRNSNNKKKVVSDNLYLDFVENNKEANAEVVENKRKYSEKDEALAKLYRPELPKVLPKILSIEDLKKEEEEAKSNNFEKSNKVVWGKTYQSDDDGSKENEYQDYKKDEHIEKSDDKPKKIILSDSNSSLFEIEEEDEIRRKDVFDSLLSREKQETIDETYDDYSNFDEVDDKDEENANDDYDANSEETYISEEIEEEPIAFSNEPLKVIDYNYPSLELLNSKVSNRADMNVEISKNTEIIENTLEKFGISSKVVDTIIGPTFTRYELEIPMDIRVDLVRQYATNLQMRLKSNAPVIVQAPIPGKDRIGIEVANIVREDVMLKDVLNCPEFQNSPSKVVFGLGQDVSGKNMICDIRKMPHLLIAGATNSGKSVCLNVLIMSLLFHASPDDVRLILIDPKFIEFSVYENIPHLLTGEIISGVPETLAALDWAYNETIRRFQLFKATKKGRNIDEYNESIDTKKEKKLSRIVIVFDEVADFMLKAKKELEDRIVKIAQLARAAGIHLVLATQRPSVDVITGLIKSNLPNAIAFKVAKGTDSMIILDEMGAESLLGSGDLLYKDLALSRYQGAYVSLKEIKRTVDNVIANNREYKFDEEAQKFIKSKKSSGGGNTSFGSVSGSSSEDDELMKSVLRYAIKNGSLSTSIVQRKFEVGYPKAGKILDKLEEKGYISELQKTNKPREVFITAEEFKKIFNEDV